MMKRVLTLLLTAMLILSTVSSYAVSLPDANVGGGAEGQYGWYYGDPMNGVNLFDDDALEMLGDKSELLIALEKGDTDALMEQDGMSIQMSPYAAVAPTQLDMTVYDVLGFANKSNWTMDGDAAEVSSVYEASEYFMYRIMSGTGWQTSFSGTDWEGVYFMKFTPDVDVPFSKRASLISNIGEFVYAYFPHYFSAVGSVVSQETNGEGVQIVNTVTVAIWHSTPGNPNYWKEEYEEAEKLMSTSGLTEISAILGSGKDKINTGTDAEKLKNAHDYIVKKSVYTLNGEPHIGQRAYCALVEGTPVCNGYALALSMLSFRMGLDVPYMRGDVEEGPHAWNLNLMGYPSSVLLVDATWNDQPNIGDGVVYDYYNKPLDGFRQSRTWTTSYESYIDYVHGKKDNLNQSMMFDYIAGGGSVTDPTPGNVIVPSDGNPYIDLTDETITLSDGYVVAAYSVNGGKKWKKGPLPTEAKFQKLFNKGMTLWVSDKWNPKAIKVDKVVVQKKGVPDDANIVKFAEIAARPKVEKLTPFYPPEQDNIWVFAKKGDSSGTPVTSGYYWSASADGKKPDGNWTLLDGNGFQMKTGKKKDTYFIRTAPSAAGGTYTPGSKMVKVKPANYAKTPKYKIKNKKDPEDKTKIIQTISIKKGDAYSVGAEPFVILTAKTDFNVSELAAKGTTLLLKKAATGKKPASEVQELGISVVSA